jgi:hypothetical protein
MKRIVTLSIILLFAFATQMLFAQPWYARGDLMVGVVLLRN